MDAIENIQCALLAFMQGMTEFLPVSSSGHLVFFQKVFGFKEPMLLFDIILHLATTLSVIVFLRKELILLFKNFFSAMNLIFRGEKVSTVWKNFLYFRISLLIFVALIPAIVIGASLSGFIEKMFVSFKAVGVCFLITGTVLFFTRQLSPNRQIEQVNVLDAFFIGLAQAAAIFPGISRSGLTISAGMFRGLDRNFAAKFSFILAIPTILAAAIYELRNGIDEIRIGIVSLVLFFCIAFVSGYIALVILSKMISKAKFHYFSYYCWLMGIISIVLSFRINK